MGLSLRKKNAAAEVALAAAYAEIERLRAENQRLATEHGCGVEIGPAVGRADRVAETAGALSDASRTGADPLVLREMFIEVCVSVEEAMAAVRAQLSDPRARS
jgi:hypothetical protein